MALFSFTDNSLKEIEATTFNNEGILERRHLQAAIKQQIDVIAPNCLVISEEFSEWSGSQRRIDLLAVDREGNLVVIELKRTETGENMELQALRYAAMVSTLTFSRAVEIYRDYLVSIGSEVNAESDLLEFLGWEGAQGGDFALDVRMILVSSNFSKELTTSVMWLNERNLNIRCVRLIPYKYQNQVLISVEQLIPLPEAESYQIKIKKQSEEKREARQSSKDYTQYSFQGNAYNKRKLVLAVVHKWISDNKPGTLPDLLKAFPQEIISGGLFVPVEKAKEKYDRHGIYRHFLGDEEIVKFPDSTQYAISNQWAKREIERFLSRAKEIGYEIEEIS
jgi:hypothetical protein